MAKRSLLILLGQNKLLKHYLFFFLGGGFQKNKFENPCISKHIDDTDNTYSSTLKV